MVTLSVTRSRVAALLRSTASLLLAEGWDPHLSPLADAIDRAAGYWPGRGASDAEAASVQAWDGLAAHVGGDLLDWERADVRTQDDVLAALHGAAEAVTS